jgi:hypothetical protein
VVKSQATRSRSQNHKIAARILAEKIEFMEKGPESRTGKVRERERKRKGSAGKKSRRKYRRLAGEAVDDGGDGDGDGDGGEGEEEGFEEGEGELGDEDLVVEGQRGDGGKDISTGLPSATGSSVEHEDTKR